MSDMEILKQNKPEVAEVLAQWRRKYERGFDFSNSAEQANFYEAMLELGRHLASTASSASIQLGVSNLGVDRVSISVTPEATGSPS